MKKILIADLLGTLIPENFIDMYYLYGDYNIKYIHNLNGDDEDKFININNQKQVDTKKYANYLIEKSILKLKILLELFLKENNNLYIVSEISSHGSLDIFTNDFFSKIYELFHEYSNNIFFFGGISDINRLNEIKNVEGFSRIKKNIAYFDNGMKIQFINKKEQVYDYIENLYPGKLYAIGNNAQSDLGMLLKCIELGGKSSFIVEELYDFDLNKEIIKYIDNNFIPDFDRLDKSVRKEMNKKFIAYEEKIYKDMACGNLEMMDIVENNLFYEIKEDYNAHLRWDLLREDGLINDIAMISKIQIYPSFLQFAQDNLPNNKRLTLENNN